MIWLPIESDAEIVSKYAWRLGMKESHEFIDLFTFDSETAKEFGVPTEQCKGMILLFPLSEESEPEKQIFSTTDNDNDFKRSCKFIKQTVENSCCLMALLHILLNSPEEELLLSSTPSFMKDLLKVAPGDEAEKIIETSSELAALHEEFARYGQQESTTISTLDAVPFHFVALIPQMDNKGEVCLLDGRREGPIKFQVNEEAKSFFDAACSVAQREFVQKSQDQTNFAAMILI